MTALRRLAVLALVLALAPPPARAQSTRYSAPPRDKDREQDRSSQLWEQAVEPQRAPQARLLAEASRLLAGRTPHDVQQAVAKVTEAIALGPADPEAYFLRGMAYEQLQRWNECAADVRQALELRPDFANTDLRYGDNPLLGLGVCLARAGKLAEAEVALHRAVARSPGVHEWLRLGETRIAMGKLREGVEALLASTEASGEASPSALNWWLRALAYDRGRQSSLASEAVAAAAVGDRFLRQLTSPMEPFVSKADELYLLGLGWEGISRPELALAHFRAALEVSADGPWARRTREHVAALEQTSFPLDVARSGPAPLDPDLARATVRKAMPALAACVAALPHVAFTLRITRARPATTGTGIHTVPPVPGVTVTQDTAFGEPSAEVLDRATRCLTAETQHLDLPAIKEPGTWYYLTFSLIWHRAGGRDAAPARPRPTP